MIQNDFSLPKQTPPLRQLADLPFKKGRRYDKTITSVVRIRCHLYIRTHLYIGISFVFEYIGISIRIDTIILSTMSQIFYRQNVVFHSPYRGLHTRTKFV